MKTITTLFTCWLLCNAGLTLAQPGTLDNTFSSDGKVTTTVGTAGDDEIQAIAVQADGKIVSVGNSFESSSPFHEQIAMVRYNTNGSIDKSFGVNGIVKLVLSLNQNFASGIKIRSNGKILVSGTSITANKSYDFILLRFNSNGTRDGSFGTNGIVFTDFNNSSDISSSMAIQEDGKVLVAGTITIGQTTKKYGVVRYNTDGTLDATFGQGGKVTTQVNDNDVVSSVAVQPGGKIIVAGRANKNNGSYDFALVRYNPNGSVDNTFGTLGKVITDIANSDDFLSSMVIQSDGKIVIGGTIRPDATRFQIALVRYNNNGSLDKTFSSDGKVITIVNKTANDDETGAITLQLDGKIILVGISNRNFVVIRYLTNGSRDGSFGTNGVTSTVFNNFSSYATSVALQSDSKIVAAGYAFSDVTVFALARYKGDNSVASASTRSDVAAEKSQIKIYPNPTNDYIHITGLWFTAPATISITDNTGRVLQKINAADNTVNVKMLPQAVYYLLIDQNGKRSSLKFEKQ